MDENNQVVVVLDYQTSKNSMWWENYEIRNMGKKFEFYCSHKLILKV